MTPNELLTARMQLAKELKDKRVKAKLSKHQLAKKAGLARWTVNCMESGDRSFNINSLLLYENALKQSV